MTHIWRLRAILGHRFGQPCRITAVSRRGESVPCPMISNQRRPKNMGSIRVQFADGFEAVTTRYAVRKLKK